MSFVLFWYLPQSFWGLRNVSKNYALKKQEFVTYNQRGTIYSFCLMVSTQVHQMGMLENHLVHMRNDVNVQYDLCIEMHCWSRKDVTHWNGMPLFMGKYTHRKKTKEGQILFLLPNLLNCFVVKFNRNSSDEGLDIIVACLFPVLNQKEMFETHNASWWQWVQFMKLLQDE